MAEKEDVAAFMESQEKGDSSLAAQLKEQWGSSSAYEKGEDAAPADDAAAPPEPEPDTEA